MIKWKSEDLLQVINGEWGRMQYPASVFEEYKHYPHPTKLNESWDKESFTST
jgi:hypothetical protein